MIVKTKSFEIATYEKGDTASEKLAIALPGKLDSKDYADMRGHVDFLASLGFRAFSFDPPGTWESPGDISLYNVTNYLKSINELIEYYGNKPTFLVGHSRGGTMAMIAGTRNPYVTCYVSIMSGMAKKSISTLFEHVSMRDLPPGGGEKVKKFVLPDSFHEDEIKYSLSKDIIDSQKPKLLVAGAKDKLIPAEKVKETFNLLSDPKEYYLVDCEHDYRFHPDKIEELNGVIKDFLEKYNLL